jgi:hypothetical protein
MGPPRTAPAGKRPLATSCEKAVLFFECFPYVCPEPVLVKTSHLYTNGFKRPFPHTLPSMPAIKVGLSGSRTIRSVRLNQRSPSEAEATLSSPLPVASPLLASRWTASSGPTRPVWLKIFQVPFAQIVKVLALASRSPPVVACPPIPMPTCSGYYITQSVR